MEKLVGGLKSALLGVTGLGLLAILVSATRFSPTAAQSEPSLPPVPSPTGTPMPIGSQVVLHAVSVHRDDPQPTTADGDSEFQVKVNGARWTLLVPAGMDLDVVGDAADINVEGKVVAPNTLRVTGSARSFRGSWRTPRAAVYLVRAGGDRQPRRL